MCLVLLSTSFRTLASVSECSNPRFCLRRRKVFHVNGRTEDTDDTRTENAADLTLPALWLKSSPMLCSGSRIVLRTFAAPFFSSTSNFVSDFTIESTSDSYLPHL